MNNNTFGNTKAANKLEELLNDCPVVRRKIATLLSQYRWQLCCLTHKSNDINIDTIRLCMELLRDYTLNRINLKSGISLEVKSYTRNVIISQHRFTWYILEILFPLKKKTKKDLTLTKKSIQ